MRNASVSIGFSVPDPQPLGIFEPLGFSEPLGFGFGFAVCFTVINTNWCASDAGAPATKLLED